MVDGDGVREAPRGECLVIRDSIPCAYGGGVAHRAM